MMRLLARSALRLARLLRRVAGQLQREEQLLVLRRRPTGQSQIVSRHARALAAGMAERRDVQEPPSHQGVPHLGAGKKTVPAYTVYKPQRLEASSVRRGLCKFDGRCSPRRSGTPG